MSAMTTTSAQPHADEDTILFESTPFVVFGEFSNHIDVALTEGVSSLPLLPKKEGGDDEGGDEKLMRALRKAYLRNVDVAEVYSSRNIFSVQNCPPSRRTKIVQAFIAKKNGEPLPTGTDRAATHKTGLVEDSYQYPTKDDIPSASQMRDMKEETKELRTKLRAARRHRNELVMQLERLATTDQSVKTTIHALQESTNTKSLQDVHESVTAMAMGKVGLDQLRAEGADLVKKLDEEKRERGDDDDHDIIEPKKPKLTLEEEYKEQRKITKTTVDGIAKINELLKHR